MTAMVSGPVLELRQVWRTYPAMETTVVALAGIDLTIDPGELVAIVGRSGSGKSTLLNILGCLDRPTRGDYRVAGQITGFLNAYELAALRCERIGFVFQRYNLLPDLTALQNVQLPAIYAGDERSARDDRARALLTRLDLADRLDHLPTQLSGGQQQRVSIARALMNAGEIILADEPTGALDSQARLHLLRILQELNAEGRTVIIVTHDPDIARVARRYIELSDGRVVSDQRRSPSTTKRHVDGRTISGRRTTLRSRGDRVVEALRTGMRSMRLHRLRTVLTLLSMVIGIASVASVDAFGRGGQEKVLQNMRIFGTNTLDILPGQDWGDENAASIHTLIPADADAIAREGPVESVTPTVLKQVVLRLGGGTVKGFIIGVGERYFQVHDLNFAKGGGFSHDDTVKMLPVAVINETAQKALFREGENPIDKVILVNGVPFRVIGITQTRQNMDNLVRGDIVWAPYTAVMSRVMGVQHLRGITMRVRDDTPPELEMEVISRLLVRRHGRHDFFIVNTNQAREAVQDTVRTVELIVGFIAAVALAVAGMGIMNIMLVSVTERIREIGIRMAIGARRGDILLQFLLEAVLLCLLGGILGVVLALGVSLAGPYLFQDFPMDFSMTSIVAAVVVSTITGIVSGIVPARRAARLDPVAALARE
jgi:macrolide transport system ATP-binding/permease protein